MSLVYWYKDEKTKEPVYYDTDDLSNKQYAEVQIRKTDAHN